MEWSVVWGSWIFLALMKPSRILSVCKLIGECSEFHEYPPFERTGIWKIRSKLYREGLVRFGRILGYVVPPGWLLSHSGPSKSTLWWDLISWDSFSGIFVIHAPHPNLWSETRDLELVCNPQEASLRCISRVRVQDHWTQVVDGEGTMLQRYFLF